MEADDAFSGAGVGRSGLSSREESAPMSSALLVAGVEARLQRLQRISLDLTAAVSLDEVVAAVIDVLEAPVAAPVRGLWLCNPGSDVLELVAERGMAPESADRFRRMPLSADLPGSLAVRERRTVVSVAPADAVEQFATLHDVVRSTSGFLTVPLVADRTCIGVLGVGVNQQVDERDLVFFEAVAAQVAQTIVRIRLTERELRRRAELEFLANLTDTALGAVDHVDLMRQVCTAAVPTLGDWCSLHFVPESGGPPLVAFAHADQDKIAFVEELQRRYPYDPNGVSGVPAVIRTGKTEFVPELTPQIVDEAIAASRLDLDEAMTILDAFNITSVITVALLTKRRIVGAMQFVTAESRRRYDDADVALAEAVAGRLAEALDAAWIADQQRIIATSLQHALLPPALPEIPGIDLAARYWPAGVSQVGGDFYDVFALDDGRWAMLIGDVCGSGPDAAAVTSIARHTVRAAARHGADASTVMSWLNEAVLQSNRDRFCTACYATLTIRDGGWQLASTAAGHPLPIAATATGTDTIGQPGTLIGVLRDVTTSTAEIDLHPGDVVVFYTDGITDLPPPYGIDTSELIKVIHHLRHLPTAEAVAAGIQRSLHQRVPDRTRQDDVALLVVRIR
jgi:serine phosphatase RsbU (regulator of sigma subunit)